MIRARESNDRIAIIAHGVLDQAQRESTTNMFYVNWALAYLGDRFGTTTIPPALLHGYGGNVPMVSRAINGVQPLTACWRG